MDVGLQVEASGFQTKTPQEDARFIVDRWRPPSDSDLGFCASNKVTT